MGREGNWEGLQGGQTGGNEWIDSERTTVVDLIQGCTHDHEKIDGAEEGVGRGSVDVFEPLDRASLETRLLQGRGLLDILLTCLTMK